MFFLWRYYTTLYDKEQKDDKSSFENQKRDIAQKLSEARKHATDREDTELIRVLGDRLRILK